MTPRPLSEKLRRVLVGMLELEEAGKSPATPNQIASECGYQSNMAKTGKSGRGNSTRVMGVAVHVNTAITSLDRRGLVRLAGRRDGLSGSAYVLRDPGRLAARRAREEGLSSAAAQAEGKRVRW